MAKEGVVNLAELSRKGKTGSEPKPDTLLTRSLRAGKHRKEGLYGYRT